MPRNTSPPSDWCRKILPDVPGCFRRFHEESLTESMLALWLEYFCIHVLSGRLNSIRGSIVASIPACHAGDPGSIPGRGVLFTGPATEISRSGSCRGYPLGAGQLPGVSPQCRPAAGGTPLVPASCRGYLPPWCRPFLAEP